MINFLFEKIKNNKQQLFLFLGTGIITLFSFLFISFLSHTLPVKEYGTYRQLLTFINIGTVIGALGLSNTLYYYLNLKENTKEESYLVLNSVRLLLILSAGLSILLLYFLSPGFTNLFDNPLFIKIIYLGFISIVLNVFQSTETNLFLYLGRFNFLFLNTLLSNIIKLALWAYGYFNAKGLEYFLWVNIVISFISIAINTLYVESYFSRIKFQMPKFKNLSPYLLYTIPIGLGLISNVILNNTDRLVLSHYIKDLKAFAVLSNGAFEVPFIAAIYGSFSTIAFPAMVKYFAEGNIMGMLKCRFKYIRSVTLVLYPLAYLFIFWSKPIIDFVFGPSYSESALIFSIFSSVLLIRFCSHLELFFISGKTKFSFYIQFAEIFVNILITILFVNLWGIVGAALAYVLTNLLYFITVSYFGAKSIGVNFAAIYPIKFILFHLLYVGLIAFICSSLPVHFLFSIGLYFSILILIFFLFNRDSKTELI